MGIIKVQKDTNHILDKMDVFYLSLSLTQRKHYVVVKK